eukprot:gb/GECG01009707.1/.p1 GENE.gb/GECG01009707.1/~~gb/GECG01009707.1/.p1  ORF type:complete len:159 (+),score=20.18 gb/GECG01009707.1/:1-477(+)
MSNEVECDTAEKSNIAIQTESFLNRPERQKGISAVAILPSKRKEPEGPIEKSPKKGKTEHLFTRTTCCMEHVHPNIKSTVSTPQNYSSNTKAALEPKVNDRSLHSVSSSPGRGIASNSAVSTTSRMDVQVAREQNPSNMRHNTPTTVPHHIDPLFFDL